MEWEEERNEKKIIIFIEGVKENAMVGNTKITEQQHSRKSINKQHAFTQEINHSNEIAIIAIVVAIRLFVCVCVWVNDMVDVHCTLYTMSVVVLYFCEFLCSVSVCDDVVTI